MNAQSLASSVAALAFGASILPCSGTAPVRGSQEPMLEFEVTGSTQAAEAAGPTIDGATAAAVEVTGTISTPNPCYEVGAELGGEGHKLELVLTARAKGGMCVQVIANFEYRARITGLEAGAYDLVTVYRYPQTGWEERRFNIQVEVPEDGR